MTEISKAEQELAFQLRETLRDNTSADELTFPRICALVSRRIIPVIKANLPELDKEAGYRIPAGKAPLLTDEQISAAFNGDFTPVTFDHKPTADDVMLLKLKLVSKAQNDADNKHFGR